MQYVKKHVGYEKVPMILMLGGGRKEPHQTVCGNTKKGTTECPNVRSRGFEKE